MMLDYGLDLSTPYGEFGATMLMAAAQLERDLISMRTKEGLTAAKAKGILPGPSRSAVPPDVTDKIMTLIAEGATLAEVANQLTQDHVPLPSGVPGIWQPPQVRRVLRERPIARADAPTNQTIADSRRTARPMRKRARPAAST